MVGWQDKQPIEWQLGRLLHRSHQTQHEQASRTGESSTREPFCLVVLNQPFGHEAVLHRLWGNALTRVAADGGANYLYAAGGERGQTPFDDLEAIIGDLDSLRDEVRQYFESAPRHVKVIHDPDQNSTDFGKAVMHVRASHSGTMDIVALGGLGGRVDQGLSQLHHLYLFQKDTRYSHGRMYLVSDESMTFLLKAGAHRIRVRDGLEEVFGKHVGIIPIGEPSKITTKGLEWDVEDWETQFGGQISTSNHVLPETEVIQVYSTRDVLFTIALKHLDE